MPSLEDYWYIACRSPELADRPLARQILGRPLVLFRGPDGQPAALEDRCLHRGAPLSGGVVERGCVACPYHGWRYGPGGEVVEIPAMAAAAPEGMKVSACHVVEQDGFVWVFPGAGVPAGPPRRLPLLGEPGWHSFTLVTPFQTSVEACLENFLDCPHATTVHRSWFRTPTAKVIRTVVRTRDDGAEAEYFDEPREKSLVWTLLAPSSEHQMRHTDRFIAPATSEVDYQFTNQARYLITSNCTPVDDRQTLVYTVITFRFGWLTPLIRLVFEPLARQIIRQDQEMLDRVEANLRRFGRPRYQVIPQDLLLPHIAQWRKALETGAEPPPAGREKHVDLRL